MRLRQQERRGELVSQELSTGAASGDGSVKGAQAADGWMEKRLDLPSFE